MPQEQRILVKAVEIAGESPASPGSRWPTVPTMIVSFWRDVEHPLVVLDSGLASTSMAPTMPSGSASLR